MTVSDHMSSGCGMTSLNSPGGSTLHWVVGRGLLYLSSPLSPSATVVSAEPFSHGTGTLRCLQKEMATYRHWSVSLWRDPDDVPHCRILSPGKTEWRLISTTLCGWRRCFVADQLWFLTHIRVKEEVLVHAGDKVKSGHCLQSPQSCWLSTLSPACSGLLSPACSGLLSPAWRRQHCRQSRTCSTRSTLSKVGDYCCPNFKRFFDFVVSVYGGDQSNTGEFVPALMIETVITISGFPLTWKIREFCSWSGENDVHRPSCVTVVM